MLWLIIIGRSGLQIPSGISFPIKSTSTSTWFHWSKSAKALPPINPQLFHRKSTSLKNCQHSRFSIPIFRRDWLCFRQIAKLWADWGPILLFLKSSDWRVSLIESASAMLLIPLSQMPRQFHSRRRLSKSYVSQLLSLCYTQFLTVAVLNWLLGGLPARQLPQIWCCFL